MHGSDRAAISRRLLVLAAAAALASWPGAGLAQNYPVKPITMIVPFPAGGGVDAVGRIVADKLGAALGQQIVVDNRGGAGGVIGTRAAVKAAADGYTLIMATTGTVAVNPTLYANPGYEPLRDFTPIGLIASAPAALMAHPSYPAKTIGEVIAMAKAQPGKLNIGTPPPGTVGNLAGELFKATTGTDAALVIYKGTGPLTNDLLGGHVPLAMNMLGPAMGQLKSGGLRALAVLAPQRSALLPDVPTAGESGLPGFEAGLHYGLLAPAGTPKPIIDRLSRDLRKIVESDAVKARISADGGDPLTSTPEEYAQDIAREGAKWGALIKKLNLKVE